MKIEIPNEWVKEGVTTVTLYIPTILADSISIHRERLNPEDSQKTVSDSLNSVVTQRGISEEGIPPRNRSEEVTERSLKIQPFETFSALKQETKGGTYD